MRDRYYYDGRPHLMRGANQNGLAYELHGVELNLMEITDIQDATGTPTGNLVEKSIE